ncbi:MAG: hypothetical protein B0W54_23570 [Cellvibrio sp. 79]|nr:MAG: hypothetical protein B0W54_23570 [Cellvibrio sp. 79]
MESEGNRAATDVATLSLENSQQNLPPFQNGVYAAFADSTLWQMQRQYYEQWGIAAWAEGQVPHYVTNNPSIAKAYAEIALGFWRDLKAQGLADQPLYIIELGAGCGRFAYHFLLEFFSAFDAIRGPDDRACYVMTDFAKDTVAQWSTSSKLKPFIAQGRLDFAVFDAEVDAGLQLQHQKINLAPQSLKLPPVVIANYVFSGLRQDLFFLDKDRIYEGWLALNASDENAEFSVAQPFNSVQLNYQKRRISALSYADPQWNYLIGNYAKRLPPCTLLFPAYALNVLDRLRNLHGNKMLLLSGDRSTHELKDLATQQEPDISFHGSFSLPVNYHALMHLVQLQGGRCWINAQNDGLAIFVACWEAAQQDPKTANNWRETAFAIKQTLEGFNPNDFYRIKQTLETEAEYLTPAQMLAFLRLSLWDTKVFYLMFPYIFDVLAQLPSRYQNEWYVGLTDVWRYHLPIGEDYDLAFDLGLLAAELNRWPSAIFLFLQSLEHSNQEHNRSVVFYNLGMAHWQMASHSKAESYLVKSLALRTKIRQQKQIDQEGVEPFGESNDGEILPQNIHSQIHDANAQADLDGISDDEINNDNEENHDEASEPNDTTLLTPAIVGDLEKLRAWQAQCQSILGAQTFHSPATNPVNPKALYASLLGPHHAQALYRMQRDPELAALAGLECLRNSEHAREWIEREQSEQKHVLAILHPDFGLIGIAALECPRQALLEGGSRSGLFYYWVGAEFQWQGYGTQAMRLLHQLAAKIGVLHIFSTVDKANIASQRALAKLGYERLPFKLIGERPGYGYHHFGVPVSEDEIYSILARLLVELDSSTSLAPLESTVET